MQDLKQTDILRTRAATGVSYAQRADAQPLDISVLALGDVRVLHLPGECFVEYQKFAQRAWPPGSSWPWPRTAIWAPSGYICPMKAFDEGGYEPLPRTWPRNRS